MKDLIKKNRFNVQNMQINDFKDLKEFSFFFRINGIEGDLINIGCLFFNGENICQTFWNRNYRTLL